MKIKSFYDDGNAKVEVIRQIIYDKFGYIYQVERIYPPEEDPVDVKSCYSMDGLYIGENKLAKMLCRKYGIRKFEKASPSDDRASIGFSEREQKWCGWGDRSIGMFGIGDKMEIQDYGFLPSCEQDSVKEALYLWASDNYEGMTAKICKTHGVKGVHIEWTYSNSGPIISLRGQKGGAFHAFPKEWGHGEWEAKTLDDAKQMAIDYAKAVA